MLERKKIVATSIFFLALPLLVSAQGTTTTPSAASQTLTQEASQKSVIVATVNIQDVKVDSSEGNSFHISFNLTNREDFQTGVKYGVQLISENSNGQLLVDEVIYPEVLTLSPKSSIQRNITYVAPQLSGDYTILLISKNENGLPLALVSAGKITLNAPTTGLELLSETCFLSIAEDPENHHYPLLQRVEITSDETLDLTCTAVNHSSEYSSLFFSFKTYYRTTFGEIVPQTGKDNFSVSLAPSEKKIFTIALPKAAEPQMYDIRADLRSEGGSVGALIVQYVLAGANATILNISLDKSSYQKGEKANLTFVWTPSTDSAASTSPAISYEAILTDSTGKYCAKPLVGALTNVTKVEIPLTTHSLCADPTVTLSLKDARGEVIEKKILTLQQSPAVHKDTTSTANLWIVVISVLVFLSILGGSFYLLRKRGEHIKSDDHGDTPSATGLSLFFFLVIVASTVPAGKAKADTYILDGGLITVTANIDKSSYSPGETINVTASQIYNYGVGGPAHAGSYCEPDNLFAYNSNLNWTCPSTLDAGVYGYGGRISLINVHTSNTMYYGSGTLKAPATTGAFAVMLYIPTPVYLGSGWQYALWGEAVPPGGWDIQGGSCDMSSGPISSVRVRGKSQSHTSGFAEIFAYPSSSFSAAGYADSGRAGHTPATMSCSIGSDGSFDCSGGFDTRMGDSLRVEGGYLPSSGYVTSGYAGNSVYDYQPPQQDYLNQTGYEQFAGNTVFPYKITCIPAPPPPVYGQCGSANNTTVSSIPTGTELCTKGTPTSVVPEYSCAHTTQVYDENSEQWYDVCDAYSTVVTGYYWYCGPSAGGVTANSDTCRAIASATPTPVYSCTSLPANANNFAAPDNTGLTADTAYSYSATDTATKCQFNCLSGFNWNGSSCVANVYSCTGTLPTNTTAHAAPDNTGLTADTAYSYSATDTATKCQYTCSAGFTRSGTSCVPIVYACTGTVPTNATAYAAPDNTGLTADTAYSYSATDTATKCQYTCSAGFTRSGTSCVALLPDLTAGAVTPVTATVGVATTLSVPITNNGNGNTSTTFHTIFQSAADANGTSPGNPIVGSDIASLNTSASKTTTLSWTPSTAKTYYLRACADNNTSWSGLVTESDEGNNCGPWTAVTVGAAPTYACTGTLPTNTTAYAAPDNTGLTVDTAYTYSATDTATKCQFNCLSGFNWNGSSCTAILPDLTAGDVSVTAATAGTSISLSAPISNINASTGVGFKNLFQKANDAAGTQGVTNIGTNTLSAALAAGGTATASNSYTFPLTDAGTTRYIRACADKSMLSANATLAGTITESNENNNCGNWMPVAVAAPSCTGTLPANSSTYAGDTAGLSTNTPYTFSAFNSGAKCQYSCNSGYSWDAATQSCIVSTCAATTISGCVLPDTTSGSSAGSCGTGYSGACSYACSNTTWTKTTNTCTLLPDLSINDTDLISPTTALTGTATTFSSIVRNIGTGSTGSSFKNFMQVATAVSGGGTITDIAFVNMATLTADNTNTSSKSYTFVAVGTYSLRFCADKRDRNDVGDITESNELNNCGPWTTVTVSNPAIAGSCSVSPASGFVGDSFTWSTSGVSGGDGTYTYAWSGTDSLSGTTASVSKSYATSGAKSGSVVISSAGNSKTLNCTNSTGEGTIIVDPCYGQGCVTTDPPTSGCSYSGPAQPKINVPAQCCSATPNVCLARPTATLSASPTTIDKGQSSNLSWTSTDASTCTIPTLVTDAATPGNISTGVISTAGTATYQVTCSGPGGDSLPVFASIEVLAPDAAISATPTRVSPGSNAAISWSATGVKSCTVTGPGISEPASGAANAGHDFSTGSPQSVPIATQSTYTITCETNDTPISKSVTVNVLGGFQEF